MRIAIVSFIIATAAGIGLGTLVRRFAPRIGAVVPPRPDRWHSAPTPTMGGVGIFGATVIGFAVVALRPDLFATPAGWLPVLLAGIAMFVIGVIDDRLQLSPLAKLVSSLAVGAFLVFALAGAEPEGSLPWWYTLIGTIWFAGMCHAFNLLDNMDGLAAGVALIATAFIAAVLTETLGGPLVVLLIALAGALLGFLYWNRPPARMFMGDCGSLFIGAVLGGASLVAVFHTRLLSLDAVAVATNAAVLSPLILVVPLFDTTFVLVLRRLAGRRASKGGTDHVSHRLVALGFSERSAVRILYFLGLTGGGVAWMVKAGAGVEGVLPLIAVFAVLVVLIGIYLARVPAYNSEDFIALQKWSFAPLLKDLAFRWHAGQVLLDLVLITVSYYGAYRLRFEGEELTKFLPYFSATLPVVLGCKVAALYASGLYQRSWETFGIRDLAAVVRAVGIGSLMWGLPAAYLYRFEGFSGRVFILDGLLLTIAIVVTRASFRTMNMVAATRSKRSRRVLVYGAGGFGRLLVREMRANPRWQMNPIVFIDDDPGKAHRWVEGIPVRGPVDQLERVIRAHAVDEVILSSPAINGQVEHRIREVCGTLDRPVRRLYMEIR